MALHLAQHLVDDDGGAAAAAEAVAAGELRRLVRQLLHAAAMLREELGGHERVELAGLHAVVAGHAAPLVQRDGAGEVALLALAVRARAVEAHVDAVHRARLLAGAAEGAGVGAVSVRRRSNRPTPGSLCCRSRTAKLFSGMGWPYRTACFSSAWVGVFGLALMSSSLSGEVDSFAPLHGEEVKGTTTVGGSQVSCLPTIARRAAPRAGRMHPQ